MSFLLRDIIQLLAAQLPIKILRHLYKKVMNV
nr:MAG TPA: hypothetical protein [Caudoviricetes sp.]